MSQPDRELWAKRVQRWRESGLTAEEFATECGFSAESLKEWRTTVRKPASGKPAAQLPHRPCDNPECGRSYQPETSRSRYCGSYCMARARYLRYTARAVARGEAVSLPVAYRTERVCGHRGCRKPFMPKHPTARHCCAACTFQERQAKARDATAWRRMMRNAAPSEPCAAE